MATEDDELCLPPPGRPYDLGGRLSPNHGGRDVAVGNGRSPAARCQATGFVEVAENDLLSAGVRRNGVPATDVQEEATCSSAIGQKKGPRNR